MLHHQFRTPGREYGILPFWFLNGELDPDEMRWQLAELRAKGMPGIVLHGRYGLEMPYLGDKYLARIRLAVAEAEKLGLKTWIYDEMNWPSGTADKRVLAARPDLAQKYLECISFTVRGPWFAYLTGADSRYLDFERSKPVAAFAVGSDGQIIDLTPYLSFVDVIPWEAPPGHWRIMYLVEKEADYYIDALNPEATAEFLRLGYAPYADAACEWLGGQMPGFYTDEPAMHYYLTGSDNPIVPWTKGMFGRFQARNGYNLRPMLPHLFFDVNGESAKVRYDFYNTLTDFYSAAYYQQIHEWCGEHHVRFTGHLLYEEWLRQMIRVEGNPFKHYAHMDIIGVDHLYPFIGSRDRPAEHVAIKLASSAAHLLGREQVLCESFGGIFMDATMQRMKWIADWEYVLGVNLLNPHGFHYTLEGARKRDWPPSMFYQYPWWHYYEHFSAYMSRLGTMLTGGRHAAKVAVLWPIQNMFATYTPQGHTALADRTEHDFNALTDLLLRLHYDFDYLDEDILAGATIEDGCIYVADERFELLILPPLTHLKESTVAAMEKFVVAGGKLLGTVFLPGQAFGSAGLTNVEARMEALFGVNPSWSQAERARHPEITVATKPHSDGGTACFLRTYALARQLPWQLQSQFGAAGQPEHPCLMIEKAGDENHYYCWVGDGRRVDITGEVLAERAEMADALEKALNRLVAPDILIDNRELFSLHRVKEGQDLYFLVNPTPRTQRATVALPGVWCPSIWDPATGDQGPVAPVTVVDGFTCFGVTLPPVGSCFVVANREEEGAAVCVTATNLVIERCDDEVVRGYGAVDVGDMVVEYGGRELRLQARGAAPIVLPALDGLWDFTAEDDNALVLDGWLATVEEAGISPAHYAASDAVTEDWLPMRIGAWSYQLPAEPAQPYPLPVWFRRSFLAEDRPQTLDLIVDGFAGAEWQLYVNGRLVTSPPVRSAFDSQMQAVAIAEYVQRGENIIALRLIVTSATDGLLDLLKLVGDFSLCPADDGGYTLASPRQELLPAPWTEQGYPFYSGRGLYRRHFNLQADLEEQRVFVEAPAAEDVVEVIVNGHSAGVCLWEPYCVEVTPWLRMGENVLEVRVANTLINLLEGVVRPSGLAGTPKLVAYREYTFDLAAK